MISFDSFRMEAGTPIYQQILRFIQRGAVAGVIRDGDELPSRRVLSALLGVNPNTVQKAYRLLEDEGLIRSHTGAKSCMVLDDDALARIRAALLAHEARRAVAALKQMGLTKDEALTLLETHWEEEEE
ncbi:MAG: GntR family transcriptional regulator [Butyricicoccus sp.]|nr:GntR family transcriptional regulator [Butyricicoccus pullicaecorum]MCI6719933.1 GntR family transcriptional regulator [Clostridiales bacterium]MDY5972162.1 GntR family transcriptional regulator [Butyricicoccus sp.]